MPVQVLKHGLSKGRSVTVGYQNLVYPVITTCIRPVLVQDSNRSTGICINSGKVAAGITDCICSF